MRKKKSSEFEPIFSIFFSFVCVTIECTHKARYINIFVERKGGWIHFKRIHNEIEKKRDFACIKHLFSHTKMMMIELMETKKNQRHTEHINATVIGIRWSGLDLSTACVL